MIALRREDVRAINAIARSRLQRDGRLGDDALTVDDDRLGERSFTAGDEVVVLANTPHLGLHNGSRATVVAVAPAGGTLNIRDAAGVDQVLERRLVNDRLDHAYAVTCHKAQGLTVDVALLYGTAALTRESGYVGLSRGRRENHIYAVADELDRALNSVVEETDDLPADREGGELVTSQRMEAVVPALIDAISRSSAQRLASGALPEQGLSERVAALRQRQAGRPRARHDSGAWSAGQGLDMNDQFNRALER